MEREKLDESPIGSVDEEIPIGSASDDSDEVIIALLRKGYLMLRPLKGPSCRKWRSFVDR